MILKLHYMAIKAIGQHHKAQKLQAFQAKLDRNIKVTFQNLMSGVLAHQHLLKAVFSMLSTLAITALKITKVRII